MCQDFILLTAETCRYVKPATSTSHWGIPENQKARLMLLKTRKYAVIRTKLLPQIIVIQCWVHKVKYLAVRKCHSWGFLCSFLVLYVPRVMVQSPVTWLCSFSLSLLLHLAPDAQCRRCCLRWYVISVVQMKATHLLTVKTQFWRQPKYFPFRFLMLLADTRMACMHVINYLSSTPISKVGVCLHSERGRKLRHTTVEIRSIFVLSMPFFSHYYAQLLKWWRNLFHRDSCPKLILIKSKVLNQRQPAEIRFVFCIQQHL